MNAGISENFRPPLKNWDYQIELSVELRQIVIFNSLSMKIFNTRWYHIKISP